MTDFAVDPVIVSLTRTLADWPLCRVFLYNDSRYQWGLLVPRRPGAVEMCDLSAEDQQQLMAEIVQLSNLIRPLPGVEKLNVGNLGNMVTQLHVHVIGRFKGDPAWPGPVWGHSDPKPWPDPAQAPLSLAVSKS
ncbi:MAG: diadenosine tetraphosphate hydrolase [Alphaproteobacteria bacterium]|jgi:diadenosine tetraphosphate (Ap4A) HIT family hydrolase|nr:diadenosine tetraphosphate hydrolase [Alphaproteobacteria bacterium]MDB5740023.1 diadenosine tetraphosphate hydrolase [Alphaproteobacteria bacterium]